ARVVIAGENHGADKRLLRVRSALRLSPCARLAIGGFAVLTGVSLIVGWMPTAVIFAVPTAACAGVAAWQLTMVARRLHAVIEEAARECALVPVDPVTRSA
ncbi:MAG TPA: hypothetical protein VME45_22635, partial [Stellaceae bacterium]|nr:hypothetical protein [Stellaceae bacterium]